MVFTGGHTSIHSFFLFTPKAWTVFVFKFAESYPFPDCGYQPCSGAHIHVGVTFLAAVLLMFVSSHCPLD